MSIKSIIPSSSSSSTFFLGFSGLLASTGRCLTEKPKIEKVEVQVIISEEN
jgi:hypothetical protein